MDPTTSILIGAAGLAALATPGVAPALLRGFKWSHGHCQCLWYMRPSRVAAGLRRGLFVLQAIAVVAIPVATGVAKIDPSSRPWIRPAVESMQQHAWWIVVACSLLIGVAGIVRKWAGSAWIWNTTSRLLEDFRQRVFAGEEGPLHEHRVTLFQYMKLCWLRPYGIGWLIPIARTGVVTQWVYTAFRVRDDREGAEGIAGFTFVRQRTVVVDNLPALTAGSPQGRYEEYSRRTGVSVKWLRKRTYHPRSLAGIEVRVKGKPWGVVVLDSMNPSGIPARDELTKQWSVTGTALASVLDNI